MIFVPVSVNENTVLLTDITHIALVAELNTWTSDGRYIKDLTIPNTVPILHQEYENGYCVGEVTHCGSAICFKDGNKIYAIMSSDKTYDTVSIGISGTCDDVTYSSDVLNSPPQHIVFSNVTLGYIFWTSSKNAFKETWVKCLPELNN